MARHRNFSSAFKRQVAQDFSRGALTDAINSRLPIGRMPAANRDAGATPLLLVAVGRGASDAAAV
jgi:hypothetical protein